MRTKETFAGATTPSEQFFTRCSQPSINEVSPPRTRYMYVHLHMYNTYRNAHIRMSLDAQGQTKMESK